MTVAHPESGHGETLTSTKDERRLAFAAPDISEVDIAAIVRVLRSGWITTGEECLSLERELAAYLDCPHVVCVSSCTAALQIALSSLRLPAGARVGVPTWTFVATALAGVHVGAVPVLLDVDPETLNLSVAATAAAVDEGLDALVPVHFGGVPVDQTIRGVCASAGVPIVEDAAHALGASDDRGRIAGQGSVAACFSFYATKNLTAAEGGALATFSPVVAEFARRFRLHGLSADAWARYRPESIDRYDLMGPGIKANLADPFAALARSQLRRFDQMQARRRAIIQRYRANLAAIDGLQAVPSQLHETGADHLMVVLLPVGINRERVTLRLSDSGIPTSIHFQPLHSFEWFRRTAVPGPLRFPVADELAPRALSLPLHPQLRDHEIDRICDALIDAIAAPVP